MTSLTPSHSYDTLPGGSASCHIPNADSKFRPTITNSPLLKLFTPTNYDLGHKSWNRQASISSPLTIHVRSHERPNYISRLRHVQMSPPVIPICAKTPFDLSRPYK
ncbi:hypothetical protein CY34DRAFT_127953 [Suillus luteus UH-Slu-Lm8-n1]|uniref:Uncharacterized protein n=1 Tax=Suillus luteus UH-Slu-Lm8-n1 TaxID=930992 RepID=A0A0D0B248_9AGAM|nr:hypothetical protein CY34DRAFT_127953 [Suillus luteus UH-Slu-Lm8-n1]